MQHRHVLEFYNIKYVILELFYVKIVNDSFYLIIFVVYSHR